MVREFSQGLTNLFSQLTRAGVAVNQLFRPDDRVLSGAVHFIQPPMESPALKSRGSLHYSLTCFTKCDASLAIIFMPNLQALGEPGKENIRQPL